MSKRIAKKLIESRESKGWTQTEAAAKLARLLNQTYSLRQYQKLEEGKFPKYKKEVVQKLDELFSTNLFEMVYEHSANGSNQSVEIKLLILIAKKLGVTDKEIEKIYD